MWKNKFYKNLSGNYQKQNWNFWASFFLSLCLCVSCQEKETSDAKPLTPKKDQLKLRLETKKILGIGYGFVYTMEVLDVLEGATETKQISLTVPVGLNTDEQLKNLDKGKIIELSFEAVDSKVIDSLKYTTHSFRDKNGKYWVVSE